MQRAVLDWYLYGTCICTSYVHVPRPSRTVRTYTYVRILVHVRAQNSARKGTARLPKHVGKHLQRVSYEINSRIVLERM